MSAGELRDRFCSVGEEGKDNGMGGAGSTHGGQDRTKA
jgi:hypothetical protein